MGGADCCGAVQAILVRLWKSKRAKKMEDMLDVVLNMCEVGIARSRQEGG